MKHAFYFLITGLLASPSTFAQWQKQTVNTNASFRAVSVAGPDVAWIGGSKGTFVRTADGGKTWQTGTVPNAQTCDFRDVQAVNAQTAYLMSAGLAEEGNARIYKTTDAGKTWTLLYQTSEKGVFMDGMDFWDAQHGIVFGDPVTDAAVGGHWFMMTTGDGGQTWQPVPPIAMPVLDPHEAAFAASGTSIAVQGKRNVWIASGGGLAGRVFRSRNRGKTWTVSTTPLPGGEATGLFGLRFLNRKTGIAVGGNYKRERQTGPNAVITQDGGKTWQLLPATNPPGLKEAVAALPGNRILVVGPAGTSLSADQGQTWQPLDADGFHSVACASGTCYAVGANGKVAVQRFD